MLQPLRNRRDYDEGSTDAAMVKPIVPSPGIQQALDYDAPEAVPSMPDRTSPESKRFIIICPTCNESNAFEPDGALTPDASISCPKCASSVKLSSFVRSKEGSYVSKEASSSMGVSFKRLWKMIPKGKEVTLSKSQVNEIHDILHAFKVFHDKVKNV